MSRRVIPGLEAPDARLEAEIRARLDQVEEALEKAVRADSDLLARTSRYLLAAGGKRFRPMLVLLSGYFGDPTDPRLIPGSVAIELVHLATLYHDDVIDEADSRRGIPSVNVRWSNTVAILTGDYLFARASEISTDLGTEVCRLLARTIAVLCDGQIREVEAAGRLEQSEEAYLEVIRRKTGSLIATSCRLGAMLSDAPPEHVDTLEAFGASLGLAFQLSDDIMDVTASQLELGKEPGVDMREGVYTLPILHALRHGERREELARILAQGPPQGERLDRALEIVRGDGSLAHARRAVAAEVDRARALAGRLPEGPPRAALEALAEFLAVRCGARDGA
ncbi:MAG TPA: polyprenyl synthetase family protein [Actinomycetota bacterium]|nr:polyprenyl synthetase family protein [Actinomycetota bacterium]